MHLWLRAATCASIWTRITFAACDTESTTTLANSNVITALTSCATFSGSVALATDISGHIALDGVQEITGDVYISNASELVSLTGDSLSTIGGDLTLDGVQKLSTLDFPRLTSVGNVTWSSLPNLQSVGLDQGLSADEVDIQNTQLQQLNITKAAKITIVNNPFAANISIAVNNVTNDLVISANNPAMTVDLPNLYWANNITLTNVSDVSMPLLNTIGNNFNIYGSTIGVLKIPNLNVVWGGLSLISNYQLTSIQIPSLVQVGTLVISNNSELRKFTLDELGIVSYAITVDGHLSK
ncbi:hypothetical protein K491DRAFT_29943 [Lophiostoma macrostomum CBS 122681]|uniref:GPI-anchored cell wall organization protein Ecm33 n=1 Tax=Lophiostoma macrostomum CBS 122681 TaxID=1314788 RepID=A0A6A6SYN8_9PLEO|nr:hypothetical protein K491DRAFT_29943 [Lophiostoma macrostomum CBS 122681]